MIHLHNHTEYSALDGLMKIDEMLDRAQELGVNTVAMTDHACISGLPEFYSKARARGMKPIIGCEFYCAETKEGQKGEKRIHLNVLAKNWSGVQSIMKHLTIANRQFYYRPRLTIDQIKHFKDCVVTTACCIGPLIRDDFMDIFAMLHQAYGEDLYMEVMPHVIIDDRGGRGDLQRIVNERAMALSQQYGTKLVATNDAHYARAEDAQTHDILLAIQSNRSINDPKRWRMGTTFYMKSIAEMAADFRALGYMPDEVWMTAMKNTVEVAQKCWAVEMPDFPIELPSPYVEADEKIFGQKLMEGWRRKIAGVIPAERHAEYQKRLLYEIEVIKGKDFTTYFLVVEDVIRWSREQGIMVGPARGSSCGSLVCYLLDITQVDPLEFELYFERFLNPERIDYPDIDIDFQDDRRAEVFEYVRGKYGHDKTASISTFSYLKAKSAFRDVSRLSGIPLDKVNKLSKLIEAGTLKDDSGKVVGTYTDAEAFDHIPELIQFKQDYPIIVEQALKLNGRIRQMGVHAAGLIVAKRPLIDCAAIVHKEDTEAICWDKRTCEKPFGLIKMDLLGLGTLSVLNHTAKLIKDGHGVDIEFTKLPLNDEKVMKAFSEGDSIGIFQFESDSSRRWLKAINAQNFNEVTDITALNRPGSLESGETERYARIARGDDYETYSCAEIEAILKPTKGVLIYQEQMMRIFVDMGGFTFAEADKMRKIVGKKLGADEFNKHKEHFVTGCVSNGINKEVAEDTFGKMVSFANYSFNKSHACCYTHLSAWSMYLKLHYPVEYMCALLSKTTKRDNLPVYIKECKRMGIPVQFPDINRSAGDDYIIDNGEIIAPLSCIKGVGTKAVEHIIEVRDKGGVFLSTKDFEDRITKRQCNKRVREALFMADAFHSLGEYEIDDDRRILNLKKLLSLFETLPQFEINEKRPPVDKGMIQGIVDGITNCAAQHSQLTPLMPVTAYKPAIMWINNPTQHETAHFSSKVTRWLLECLDYIGIKTTKVYYTSPLKCNFGLINNAPKECCERCPEVFLKAEIKAVQPKLIVCSSAQFQKVLGADSAKIGDMANRCIFNEELDCYVLFTYSPQNAKFNAGPNEKYMETLEILKKIFNLKK